jgi:ABC-type phosphate transport system permease subunit
MSVAASTPDKPRGPRRTRQSGFSLLARGEPKIWLTGGMLVICLAMIVSLLALILVNGLATFWPARLDWLMLADGQMDIGEPQRIAAREGAPSSSPAESLTAEDATPEAATTEDSAAQTGTESAASAPAAKTRRSSRFYRTANFDVTGRHYRWFEPHELRADGILQPQWAVVVERLSWGRLYALPSRLWMPVQRGHESPRLASATDTDGLMHELESELQGLAEQASADWSGLTAAIAARLETARGELLRTAAGERLKEKQGTLLVQPTGNDQWQQISDADGLAKITALAAARVAWDDPAQILKRIGPLVHELTANRHRIERTMRQISSLDRRLSDARVDVRQAEIDTGLPLMVDADRVGPLVETLVRLERLDARLEASAERATEDFADAQQAESWRRVVRAYRTGALAMQLAAARAELDAWRAQLSDKPPTVFDAMTNFENMWRQTLEKKQPLERQIESLAAAGEGCELLVSLPSNAQAIEVPPAASEQLATGDLATGDLPAAAVEALSPQGIAPVERTAEAAHFGDRVTQVSFEDPSRGRLFLWHYNSEGESPSPWLLSSQMGLKCDEIVRIFPANRLSLLGKLGVYAGRWGEFLADNPREANTEGGVFPAIWGTVVMTLIMTLAVVPFGVIAALYLREYTRSGPLVSLVRISINNLAGVPSIVYGVFGLAFFCYAIGAFIDGGPRNAEFGTLPSGTWYTLLATTVAIGVVAFLFSLLSSGPEHSLTLVRRWLARIAPWLWLVSLLGAGVLLFKSPFFHGFYEARLPTPTFGKEGLLWAAFTLALLTLPVVIVATEEALAAVPNSLREGSLACGASKWQTIHRIVLPHARPGILTGAILAMARGIGEVAPLMLVGALPVAPDLPLDTEFPYFHGSRSFMHLGYQIYWLGFQSQNSEASKPLVFTCTLLLILIVVALNLSAILLRARLRRRFQGNQF